MNKVFAVLFLLFVAATGFYLLHSSDEQQLKENLKLMAGFCSTNAQEPVVTFAQKVSSAAKLCANPCSVEISSLTIDRSFSFQEIRDHIMMMKRRLAVTKFTFEDPSIILTGDVSAEITTTLRLNGKNVEGRFTDAYEVQIGANKVEGDWLFSSFTVVEFMER